MNNSKNLDCFDHVVVLMMENRSFDNILGYSSSNVDGVIGKNLSNPAPARIDGTAANGAEDGPVFVSPGVIMDNPNPDPGEYFPHVNTQLYNTVSPSGNAHQKSYKDFCSPYNQPEPKLPFPAPMTGFVQDYYDNFIATNLFHLEPSREEYSVIMNCFPPDRVPVMSGLSEHFGVFDKWHCAVPSQTFCNRSFFNAATSNGQVINAPFPKWLEYDQPTIFNRLEDKNISWAIYFDEEDVFPLTLLIHFQKLFPFLLEGGDHFRHMDRFYKDVDNGELPAYSFVEPRLFRNHNDQHPPVKILGIHQKSTVTAGEELINDVYNAIRCSNCDEGSNSINTLLTITYDEHGGCYDHVPPPESAIPPDDEVGQMDFAFDRLGIRVPTVMISAWIEPGTVINDAMQHTSMIKTLSMKWNLDCLTNRDESAPDFLAVFNRTTAKPGNEWQEFFPIEEENVNTDVTNADHLLNELQKAIVSTVNCMDSKECLAELADDMTVQEAIDLMKKIWSDIVEKA